MLLIDQVLPLADHAQGAVVEHHGDDGQVVVLHSGQLMAVHSEAAVPSGMDDHLVRAAHLGPDGRSQTEAHGAEAAGGEQLAGVVEVEVLDRPHLMLPHVGGHDGALGDSLLDGVQDLSRGQAVHAALYRLLLPQGEDVLLPLSMLILGKALVEQFQHPLGGAHNVVVGEDVLVDLRAVDVDVYDLGLTGEGVRLEGHPVREAAAHRNEQVALVAGHVAGLGAVHPDHPCGQGVGAGETAAAHDRDGNRGVQLLGKGAELPVRPPPDHAAAADQQGALRLGDHLHQSVDVPQVGLGGLQAVAHRQLADAVRPPVLIPGDELIVDHGVEECDILQKVDEHRAGPAGGRHGKGLAHHIGNGLRVPDQIGGLGDGHGDAGDVHLLEGVLTQQPLADVAGDEYHG